MLLCNIELIQQIFSKKKQEVPSVSERSRTIRGFRGKRKPQADFTCISADNISIAASYDL